MGSKLGSVRKACQITDKVFNEIVKDFNFKTEKDVEKYIIKRFKELGAGYSYRSIVANNNSIIHAEPKDLALRRGFLLLDFGARYNGWCSDMTRTIFLGEPTKSERKLYELVLNCQKKCLGRVKPGVRCAELHNYALKLLGKEGKSFAHALGHGVGWRVHQKPIISNKRNCHLEENDIIAIEPGIYIKDRRGEFGIRVEDTLLVKMNGFELLNKSLKKLICVKGF